MGSPAGSLVPGGSIEASGLGSGIGVSGVPPLAAGAEPDATGVPGAPAAPVAVMSGVGIGIAGGAVVAAGCVAVVMVGGGVSAMGGGGSSSFLEQAISTTGVSARIITEQIRSVARMGPKLSLRTASGHAFLGP